MRQAQFYTKEEKAVLCLLCPRRCRLAEGQTGICGARRVVEGELHTLNYGRCSAAHWDPVEKKPLYHFYPGKAVFSLGTFGCNLLCSYCQNWSIAREPEIRADGMIGRWSRAKAAAVLREAGVAFTYNSPRSGSVVCDTARLVKAHGYRTVMVTNGFISREALASCCPSSTLSTSM